MTNTVPNYLGAIVRCASLLTVLSFLSLLVGCPVSSPPSPAKASNPLMHNETTSAKDASPGADPSDAGVADSSLTNNAESKPADPTEVAPVVNPSTPAESPKDTPAIPAAATIDEPGKERLVLLLPGGPIVVDLHVTLDERPLGSSLDETLARLLSEADGDKDGRVTWDEITRQPAFQRGVYGNQPVGADNDRRQVIQRYDWNRDKLVSREELLRWLVREPHRAKPLVLDSMVSGREGSLADSSLLRCLDTNGNGRLDEAELLAAATRLVGRDTDEDEVLEPSDLEMTAQMPNDPNVARNEPSGPAVVLLGPKTDWANFQRAMQDTYSLGGPLGPDAWPAGADLFKELDLNHDNLIGRSEWATLRVVDAQLTLDGKFGSAGDLLTVRHVAPNVEKYLTPNLPANTLRFELPSGRIEIILSPVPMPDYSTQALAAINMFDADKNNYLEASEAEQALAATGGEFADVDTNGDGKIYVEELVAALKKRQSIAMDQIRIQAGYRGDAWWQVADADGDGRLDGREIDSLAGRFKALDRDQDGAVDRDEIQVAFVVGISRGGGANGVPAFLPASMGAVVTGEDLPPWFVHMDSNGDRLIGRREFLGSAELFGKLDRNGDGRLEWSELRDLGGKPSSESSKPAPQVKPTSP